MPSLVTRHFRLHNAIQFKESFSETNPTRYYYFVGKNYAYANTQQITGTVKTTSTSNTIVGQGTFFTTDLSVGDRIGITGQGTVVRVHSIPTAQTIVVTPRPANTITTGANAYIRKLFSEIDPPAPTDSYQDTYYDIWRNIIALKRIQSSDVSHVIPRYDWSNNTLYTQYTDTNANLENEQFYVTTTDGNVYKCIDNNRGANSIVKPTGTGTSLISTSDGYRWKYMYTISSASSLKFVTNEWIPVQTLVSNNGTAQWNVQQNASNGAIHHIEMIANGSGYIYLTNTFTSVTNSSVMSIKPSSSGVDDIYNGSALFISSGLGSGQLRKIINYVGATNTLTVNSAFTVAPNTSSTYVISPLVTIRGDSGGTTTSRATAYVSNTFGGNIRKITIINQGRSYSTANVVISANIGSGATAKAIISPIGGHGYDAVDELYGDSVMMNIRVTGAESNTFPTNNDVRIIGVLRDPLLANGGLANVSVIDQCTRVTIKESTGDFYADEIVIGQTSGASGRLVYFANTNSARTEGVLRLVKVQTNGIGRGFTAGETIEGLSSTITANVVSYTKPALRPYTGLIIYNENRIPITRSNDQTEDVKIVISY
jgi:hypothetical protein